MLVLSRRANEKIVFPTLGVTVEVCSINRSTARIGINAPPDVPILRQELAESDRLGDAAKNAHHKRNRLQIATLAVHLAQKQLQAGLQKEADVSLAEAITEFAALDREIATEQSARRPIRALLVEDNRNECALLAEFLRLHDIKVETAHDGQDALEYLKSHDRPDVLLLDMRMPRCDGPATVAAIRRNSAYESLRVFAVTGADQDEFPIENGPGGVDRWFQKPVNPVSLVREMNRSLSLN